MEEKVTTAEMIEAVKNGKMEDKLLAEYIAKEVTAKALSLTDEQKEKIINGDLSAFAELQQMASEIKDSDLTDEQKIEIQKTFTDEMSKVADSVSELLASAIETEMLSEELVNNTSSSSDDNDIWWILLSLAGLAVVGYASYKAYVHYNPLDVEMNLSVLDY